jgi:peptidyl-prolyl cis-trans isomerase C
VNPLHVGSKLSRTNPRPTLVGASLLATLAMGLTVITTAGCSSKAPEDAVIAQAGDREITAGLFAAFTQQVARGKPEQLDAAYRARLLQQLVQLTNAAEAEAAKNDRSTGYTAELQRLDLFAKAGATRAGVFVAPTETELQQAYDAFVKSQPAAEFHVAHILVPTKSIALGVIRRLGEGANFAALAKAESADDSRGRGGDLGWVHPGPLPKAFTDAVAALKPGDYTRQPVKTPYGWHVIRVLETRPAAVPPLASVHAQLVVNLQQQRYEAFLKGS